MEVLFVSEYSAKANLQDETLILNFGGTVAINQLSKKQLHQKFPPTVSYPAPLIFDTPKISTPQRLTLGEVLI